MAGRRDSDINVAQWRARWRTRIHAGAGQPNSEGAAYRHHMPGRHHRTRGRDPSRPPSRTGRTFGTPGRAGRRVLTQRRSKAAPRNEPTSTRVSTNESTAELPFRDHQSNQLTQNRSSTGSKEEFRSDLRGIHTPGFADRYSHALAGIILRKRSQRPGLRRRTPISVKGLES